MIQDNNTSSANRLSKSKINLIAKLWAANIILSCDSDAFKNFEEQSGEVVDATHKIGERMLGAYPVMGNLEHIIAFVKQLP